MINRLSTVFIALFVCFSILSKNGCKAQENRYMANEFPEVVSKILPSVVKVLGETTLEKVKDQMGEYIITSEKKVFSTGSGFIISEDGKTVTANHVVSPVTGDIIVITTFGGKQARYKAKLLTIDRDADVAILQIEGKGFPHVELFDPEAVKMGEEVGFVGFPLGMSSPLVSKSVLSAKVDAPICEGLPSKHLLVVNAFVNHGNSGGPLLLGRTGAVIGIVNSRKGVPIKEQMIKLPENYKPIMTVGGVDPITLSVETHNMNLEYIGAVTQVGIGYCASIEYVQNLLKKE